MNIPQNIRNTFYDLWVLVSLVFAIPFMLAGNIGFLWAFLTLSLSLGLRKVHQAANDLRAMREMMENE